MSEAGSLPALLRQGDVLLVPVAEIPEAGRGRLGEDCRATCVGGR